MAERNSSGLMMMMMMVEPSLPAEVREKLAELELELSEGDITQKGYEKKRGKLLAPYIPQIQGVDPSLQTEPRISASSQAAPLTSKHNKPRAANSRDERFRSDLHTEAVQAALAKYKERKMPMPSKRRSVLVQSSVEACTPPDTSSASEDEGRMASSSPFQAPNPNVEHWFNRVIHHHCSSTSSSASSTSSYPGGRSHHSSNSASNSATAATVLADVMAHTQLDNHCAPPDVTGLAERSQVASVRGLPHGYTHTHPSSAMDTADGVPVNSRVSSKIQQLLNTLKRPKRPPLREFFVDDFEELLDVQQPDPNQPKPEGLQMTPLHGEMLDVGTKWPPSLLASLQRWGTTHPKSPCLTSLDNTGKPIYTLTYGKLWTRSQKLAYTLLNKLSSRNEPLLRPGDRVALVFPNNDPVMFMVAFYGCLLAELVPVPIEVPLTRKDAGSQQIGFLLGSCGVTLALTTDVCQKGLPKAHTGEVATFKGWPRLLWFVTDGKHVVKPPKDWNPPIRDSSNETAYIEYKTSKEGSTMGITVSHAAMLAHCHALTQACGYTEGETITNVLDFKRDAGLWHGVLTSMMNRMHVISIPYSLMKVNPLSWIQKVHTYKARVAVVKSRDMHWSLLSQRDQRDVSLSSLRMLIVADGANPWSISSCDAFLNVFQARGLRPEVICPCASSAEALTVAIRRPPEMGVPPPGKAVLSMSSLSHGVIRVDTEEKLAVLTLQDVGQVMPGALVCVVRPEGTPYLCKTDEVGEICVSSCTTGVSYFGLPGITKNVFETIPVTTTGSPVSDRPFTRTSLLGFIGPDDLLFVVGKMDGLMVVSGRRHNADDVVATALAVEPMKFVYRGRIAVFSVCVLHDERIVVVAEQRPDASEEDSFQWMSRVLQAIDSIHQVGVYCLALVPANTLPKAALGGIHVSETKQRFLEGALHPCTVLMSPHTCITNLPKPRQKQPEVGPASMIVGNLVAGKRIAQACGRDVTQLEDHDQFLYIQDVLQWRAQATPDHPLFLLLNAKGAVASSASCVQLHKRAERVAVALMERGRLNAGDHVALVYPPGIDLIATFYGCLYAGCVPVTVRPPHPQNLATTLPTVKMIVEVSKSVCILTTQAIMKLLKSKEASAAVDVKTWPMVLDTDDLPRKKLAQIYKPPTPEMLAYLDFSVSTTGILAGVKMSHTATSALCRSIKLQCELYPSRQIAICLDPYCGLGFALWCLCSVYSGHQSVLVPPLELESNVSVWLSAVSQFKVRVTFCSYSVMEMCTKGLGSQTEALRLRNINLSCVRTCMVVAEERPRIALTQSFSKIFKDLGLSPRAVSTTFGCRVNVAICLQPNRLGNLADQGTAGPDPTTVYVDMRALRHDRVRLVERGSPHSLPLMESGKILPGVKVIIAHTETKGPLGDSHLGEIWVSSPHNATGYYTVYGEEALHADHFCTKLSFGDTQTVWARTGYLGFLRRTELTDASGERHDALYVVGSLDETLELRGMRYHPIDIETSVIRSHKSIAECAVFTWTNLLVVVVELEGLEQEALDLVPLVTNVVLEEHYLIVGVVVVVDPGVIPINSRGEKQRMHLRDGFLADQLDPIYVAYNM
ncbi:disco-interacting protein 2 homolog A isoform X1 [Hemibagrus wyckioides]|uniref:disco-interacting protein 2 homolog A isoform X1 n=2 Tax=Hemibagrus wyckioides TaxID=337641 RepID=UPI00266C1D35|nr:disco-interacting protein 2 homolog A isoform X1 [Hemibagrus wyckioides]XP_058247387.1 disco-interacting protein 2 homolog A isoform X1 [Hemibagrus wyckioides]